MALPITITDAGRAEIINAQNTGTGPVTITEIGFGTGQYTPTKTLTALQAQIKRVSSIAGQAVAADTIHVTALDESSAAYNVGEFGLFSDKGTLIAVYSQPAASGWIIQKAGASTLLLATDIILESLNATSITFGDISFLNPPATTTVQGVVELATPEETQAGTDGARAVTPAGLNSLTASTSRAGLVQLNDTLSSNSTDQALTAAQGKKLQDEKQPKDPTLTALAALATAVNQMIYATGPDTFAMAPLTAFARSLLDDSTAAEALATLGAAPLNSPGLTGTPTAPTPAAGANTTQIANTAFVQAAISALVNSSPAALDTLKELATALGNDPNFATTMTNALAEKAPLASPVLTGDPKAPTPAATDNDTSIATTAWGRAALALFGLSDPSTQQAWHTGNLAKQYGVDDFTKGQVALTETVRRRLAGGFSSIYCDRLILLHPLYVSSLLPYSIVDGKITATRGNEVSFLNQTSVEIVSSSAYNGHTTALYDIGGSLGTAWQAVSCTYQGVKYAALIVPYSASAFGNGIFFEGRAVSDYPNQLLCIEYYNRNTATVLNAEVYNSIGPLSVQKTLRVGGETVYHTGNFDPSNYLGVNDTAVAAAKLATPRTINGVLFDGTANISLPVETPPGTVSHFARSTAPSGWLKANGAAVSRTTYAALFAAIGTTFGAGDGSSTFNLPDLRGEFLRGWDDGRGVDPSRVFGSAQAALSPDIPRDGWGTAGSAPQPSVAITAGRLVVGSGGVEIAESLESLRAAGGNVSPLAGDNRPRNIALLACIKY
jgi:phage-related tail fiber protein